MAGDKSLKSEVLIAQVAGPILRKVIPKILDAGSAGEDNGVLERLRQGDHPQRQLNSRPAKSQIRQGNYPVQTTLPARPGTQPIPEPPYQPPVNQPSPDPNPPAKPLVDPNIERERTRAKKEYEAIQREAVERQRKNDEINRESIERAKKDAERQRAYDDARSRLFNDAFRENQREKDEQDRRSREVNRVVPSTDNPFSGSGSFIFPGNSSFGGSSVIQTNQPSDENDFGQQLTKAMLRSLTSGALKDGFAEEMKKLLTPENLVMMGGLLAVVGSANIAAAAIGGPIGSAIAAVVQGAIGLAVLGGNAVTLAEATGALFGFITKAYGAKTDADYLEAAKDFAKFVNVVGPNFIANNMTGAGAAKALGSISGKLASLGGELGKLSPVRQEQIQSGLRAGRDLLSKLGKDIQGGFKGIFESINNALSHLPGNNPKKLTGNTASPNPGGKNPKKKETTVKPSRWDKVAEEISPSLDKNSVEFKELAINLSRLKSKGLNPKTVVKLHEQGITPSKLDALLEDTRNLTKLKGTQSRGKRSLDSAVTTEFHELAELVNKFLNQISKQPNLTQKERLDKAKDFIQYAVSDRQIYTFAKEIINSEKLSDVDKLGETVKNFATQPKTSSALGYQFETEFAAQLVRSGKKVTMGKGADVVDDTSKQAWQLKNSQEAESFSVALNEAAKQLTGKNQEQVPLGYLKGIKIRLTNKENPEYLKSPKQLEEIIKDAMGKPANRKWNSVDQVQIIIGNKAHIFDIKKIPGDIVPVLKGTFKYDTYSISGLPTETRVAGFQNGSPQLLSAVERYQQTVINTLIPEQRKERQVEHQMAMTKQSDEVYRRLDQVNQNIQRLNTELAGQTFNLNEIPPNILRNASSNDSKAVAYASALLLKNIGQQAFVSKESELELVKVNDTGQVTLYNYLLSPDTKQDILEAAQQLQQEQTRQAQKSNNNQREM